MLITIIDNIIKYYNVHMCRALNYVRICVKHLTWTISFILTTPLTNAKHMA